MDSLEEEKESELEEVQEELRSAQEEVLMLQQAAEEAAAERENDIASLQEELCRLRAELQRLHGTAQEYELEITTLRAEISMKSQNKDIHRHGNFMLCDTCLEPGELPASLVYLIVFVPVLHHRERQSAGVTL